jgi:hypothetical protein
MGKLQLSRGEFRGHHSPKKLKYRFYVSLMIYSDNKTEEQVLPVKKKTLQTGVLQCKHVKGPAHGLNNLRRCRSICQRSIKERQK